LKRSDEPASANFQQGLPKVHWRRRLPIYFKSRRAQVLRLGETEKRGLWQVVARVGREAVDEVV